MVKFVYCVSALITNWGRDTVTVVEILIPNGANLLQSSNKETRNKTSPLS